MIETILADMILSVFSGIYYHILCAEHGRQGKKLAACVLSLIALNLVIDVLFLTPTAANNLITFILTSAFILFWIPWLYNVPKGRILLYVMIQYGILLLVSVPLVIVVPNLMLVPGPCIRYADQSHRLCDRLPDLPAVRQAQTRIWDLPSAGAFAAEQCGVIVRICLSGKVRGVVVYIVFADLFRGGSIQRVCAVSFWRGRRCTPMGAGKCSPLSMSGCAWYHMMCAIIS